MIKFFKKFIFISISISSKYSYSFEENSGISSNPFSFFGNLFLILPKSVKEILISSKILSIIYKLYRDFKKLFFSSKKIFSKFFSSTLFKLFNTSLYIS